MSEFKDLNKLFNSVKDKDEAEFNGYETLPDGVYLAKVEDLEITESKSGKPMCVISYLITDGERKGFLHKQFLMLCGNDEKQLARNINRYATTVKKLGIDTSNGIEGTFRDFENGLNKKVKLEIKTTVSKKSGQSFTNTSFELR